MYTICVTFVQHFPLRGRCFTNVHDYYYNSRALALDAMLLEFSSRLAVGPLLLAARGWYGNDEATEFLLTDSSSSSIDVSNKSLCNAV